MFFTCHSYISLFIYCTISPILSEKRKLYVNMIARGFYTIFSIIC